MMPYNHVNIGDIFSDPAGRGYGEYSGTEWVVAEKNDEEKFIKVTDAKGHFIWKKASDRMFSLSWRVFEQRELK